MSSVNLWRVKCDTDGISYNVWSASETEPSVCPHNSAHGVVANSGKILRTIRESAPKLQREDGRLMVAPVVHPDYMTPYYTSVSDDYDNGLRGEGEFLSFDMANPSETSRTTTINFVDYVHVIGGKMLITGGSKSDYINFYVKAPASPVAVNVGNTGNCVLYDISGGYDIAHMIIPVPEGYGTHDVNLTEPMNANLAGPDPIFVSKLVPVPAYKSNGVDVEGFWDWDELTGTITPKPNQDGEFNLYDIEIVLSRYVRKHAVCCGCNMAFKLDACINHRSGPVLPHWKFELETTRDASHAAEDVVYYNVQLILARRKS